jgi:hypothetical protein
VEQELLVLPEHPIVFGQLRNFIVSRGLFLKIQGGQAVFIFI